MCHFLLVHLSIDSLFGWFFSLVVCLVCRSVIGWLLITQVKLIVYLFYSDCLFFLLLIWCFYDVDRFIVMFVSLSGLFVSLIALSVRCV